MRGSYGRWIALLTLVGMLVGTPLEAAERAPRHLQPGELRQMIQRGERLVLINSMSYLECMDHSIPGSICMATEEFVAEAPKVLPDKSVALVFYCESNRCGRSNESAHTALRMGYSHVSVLDGGMPAWKAAGYETVSRQRIPRVPVESIKPERLQQYIGDKRNLLILDVRSEQSFARAHLPGAINVPLYLLNQRYQEIPSNRPVLVVDDRGLRSFLVASFLIHKGMLNVTRLFGGMERWRAYAARMKGRS
ncbi:MAG: rhodanese-like domain-containing protein [Smithellaceae bacterium]|nr:rhodanese-like domain-containing protein [Smithellaceae bacterium]